MRKLIATALTLALMISAMAFGPTPSSAQDAKPGLFVNLTSDDTWTAAKAIVFAHERALKSGHKPVAIWLNVRAVYLADKKRAPHVHGLMKDKNVSIHDMLRAFIKDGGMVIMCQTCSAAAGLKKEDYIDGVVMGDWPTVSGILFDPRVKTLSW